MYSSRFLPLSNIQRCSRALERVQVTDIRVLSALCRRSRPSGFSEPWPLMCTGAVCWLNVMWISTSRSEVLVCSLKTVPAVPISWAWLKWGSCRSDVDVVLGCGGVGWDCFSALCMFCTDHPVALGGYLGRATWLNSNTIQCIKKAHAVSVQILLLVHFYGSTLCTSWRSLNLSTAVVHLWVLGKVLQQLASVNCSPQLLHPQQFPLLPITQCHATKFIVTVLFPRVRTMFSLSIIYGSRIDSGGCFWLYRLLFILFILKPGKVSWSVVLEMEFTNK